MATVKCKEPGCTRDIDTIFYCKDVTSLFGLRSFLENQMDQKGVDISVEQEISTHLNYVKQRLKTYQMPDEEAAFQAYNRSKSIGQSALMMRHLYLTCPLGHSYYYDVDCNPQN